jgi:hypothetical protein
MYPFISVPVLWILLLVARKSGANKDEKASAGLSEFKEFYEPL